jgi:hypothetical protein
MVNVTWASDAHGSAGRRPAHSRGFAFVCVVLAEFRRAIAAERRYDEFIRTGIDRPRAARRVFVEFYS